MTDTNLNLHPRDAHDETHDEQRPEEETFEVKHREKMSAKDLKDILGFSVLGAYIHRAAAKKRLKAAVGHIDACIYDAIRDFFKENI